MDMLYRLIVDDTPGVLDRIVGLIRRHAKNISFLMVFTIEEGRSLLVFKLVDGIIDGAISERLMEINCVHDLEVTEDNITEKVIRLGG